MSFKFARLEHVWFKLEVVGRGSETQLQVDKKNNLIPLRVNIIIGLVYFINWDNFHQHIHSSRTFAVDLIRLIEMEKLYLPLHKHHIELFDSDTRMSCCDVTPSVHPSSAKHDNNHFSLFYQPIK